MNTTTANLEAPGQFYGLIGDLYEELENAIHAARYVDRARCSALRSEQRALVEIANRMFPRITF